ncbi:MAG: biofilm regulation protein phosphatase SiaA [Halomonas sp.]|jgi:serine phosphatase RsbU (regulator of sigma subunit)|uniref:HAMP domain-containing protein n=1 Tax=Billgrantia tianxiuensis TaxID=2497861 RepID=A0A6I6SM92_9GAMM|nr:MULTISPECIES: biofilm regulation protein phosphatase SiaA [Halomonas]MCE8032534.1 SpoIIE family protein phosphatase [Halomonas sp. MCCC 1A11057]MDX5434230.1 biofilm regulation protein phosphatase SiaA [Halomonas sp.]QHC49524.1 HAMP domain-containing protein [Halomonas tianxiuensis]
MAARWGLRGKSVATLLLACLLALIPALLLGWKAIDDVRRHFANAYAENYTLLHMQRILAPVSRELALAQRFANSLAVRQWLSNEGDTQLQARFLAEAEDFRQDFADRSYFVIADASGNYYYATADDPEAQSPRYRLDASQPNDGWYYQIRQIDEPYNLNVNFDHELDVTKVWLNVLVRDGDTLLGLAGTGFELGAFLDAFIRDEAPGLTPMIVDRHGALQAHPSLEQIALGSGAGGTDGTRNIHSLLESDDQRRELTRAMQAAHQSPETIQTLWGTLEGSKGLISVGYIPELDWYLVTALDIGVAKILDPSWLWPLLIAAVLILAILFTVIALAIERLILAPLSRFKQSAQAIAAGHYDSPLPTARHDEIGELSKAFSHMADQVQRHTQELETKVRERTQALEQANAEMAATQKKLGDSIDYASFIQRAILPDRELELHLEHHHGVLWKPRDTVGGDFYLFRPAAGGYLFGVVDCAGHGVPGSLMTMLARAILDHAILKVGCQDPAAILAETDSQSRELLGAEQLPASVATHMDAGLAWVDLAARQITFAGAKIGLYASDGTALTHLAGDKRPLGHKRQIAYRNQDVALHPGWTYSLCTDGFLDQAGGSEGFGFGNSRFEVLLKEHAQRSLPQQMEAFEQALRDYQGDLPQRDDITLLSFRFTEQDHPPGSDSTTPLPAMAGDTSQEKV